MFKHILVPVDLQETQFAARALSIAVDQAQHCAADLHVLVVIPGFSMPMVAAYFPNDAFEKACRDVQQRLEAYVGQNVPNDVRATWSVRQGHPAENIVAEAKERGIDLIVMPSHTRSKLENRFIGSCAARVAELARCSV
ncbi:MAG TPA: universal stress protein, partial [Gammaproteobacteria bacterium]